MKTFIQKASFLLGFSLILQLSYRTSHFPYIFLLFSFVVSPLSLPTPPPPMMSASFLRSIKQLPAYLLVFHNNVLRSWKECAATVFHTTRAVAEAPEKLKKNLSGSAGKIILFSFKLIIVKPFFV
jgi:hypothetical protein